MATLPNTQMFALRQPPPETLAIGGSAYRLTRVFKHDFFAATCLYELAAPAGGESGATPGRPFPKLVVKYGRAQDFCGFPIGWIGEFLRAREERIYRAIDGIEGVPRWVGRVGLNGYAIEYLAGRPLDHLSAPPPGFFDRLRTILDALHARGVAYCDGNKRSNILVGEGGRPFLIDYQISLSLRDDWPWPLRAVVRSLVRYMCGQDLYFLYKHKRRLSPQELTSEEERLSRRRDVWSLLHRKLTKPYRAARRRFLREQYEKGQLVSPTATMEDHRQPEKETWRKAESDAP